MPNSKKKRRRSRCGIDMLEVRALLSDTVASAHLQARQNSDVAVAAASAARSALQHTPFPARTRSRTRRTRSEPCCDRSKFWNYTKFENYDDMIYDMNGIPHIENRVRFMLFFLRLGVKWKVQNRSVHFITIEVRPHKNYVWVLFYCIYLCSSYLYYTRNNHQQLRFFLSNYLFFYIYLYTAKMYYLFTWQELFSFACF